MVWPLSARRGATTDDRTAGQGQAHSSACQSRTRRDHSESLMLGKLCRSENSGVAELKEDGQVSCDTAQNLRLLCSYITPHARAAARPHAGASTSLAFSSSFSV